MESLVFLLSHHDEGASSALVFPETGRDVVLLTQALTRTRPLHSSSLSAPNSAVFWLCTQVLLPLTPALPSPGPWCQRRLPCSPGAVLVPWPPCSVASTPLFKCSLCPHSEGQLSLSSGAFCWEEEAEKGHWRVPCTSREAPALRNRRSNQLQVPVPSSTFTHVSPCLVFSAP